MVEINCCYYSSVAWQCKALLYGKLPNASIYIYSFSHNLENVSPGDGRGYGYKSHKKISSISGHVSKIILISGRELVRHFSVLRLYLFQCTVSALVVLLFVQQRSLPSTHAQKIGLRYCRVHCICGRYHCHAFSCSQTDWFSPVTCLFLAFFGLEKRLRRNPPGLRVVVGQNYVPIIYSLLQAFVSLLQISYQKKSFLTTPNIENQSRSSAEFH